MKNFKKLAIFSILVLGLSSSVFAQAPYKHSIGATVGNFEAFSYKTFFTNHLALQLDLGYKYTVGATRYGNIDINSLELNPNLMYEGHFTKGLYGFIGGGVSLGYSWYWGVFDGWFFNSRYRYDYGKFGVNGILGLEYKFNIPLTLQFDFRPGYGMLFNDDIDFDYFDWSVNIGVRYTF
ncbi:MAG: hypothetical protein J6T13_11215 [Bacteroidales bacterium]|nr:hypothetical protein [Bacteroidales bacterium]